MKSIKSVILILLAGCTWGCMGLLVRPLNSLGLQAMEIVALRAVVTFWLTLITLPVLCKLNKTTVSKAVRIKPKDLWIFVGTGIVSVVFFNFCYFSTIIYTSLSVAAIMLYTAPIFVMLISAVVFKEKITLIKAVALVVAFLGCAIVTGAITGQMVLSTIGLLYGIGAGIGYALYSIFGKLATDKGYSSVTVTLYTFLMTTIGVIPFADIKLIVDTFVKHPGNLAYALAMVVLTTYLPYILYTSGLAGVEPGKAAIIACIEPVMATFVGRIFYKESLDLMTCVGVLLVIAAIGMTNLGTDTK